MKRTRRIAAASRAVMLLAAVLVASGSVSCGGRMMYKSTVHVGTTDTQTAFYAALIVVNKYRYPFETVDAGAGVIRTAHINAGKGRWFAFNIQIQPTGEILIDPVTNMEKATANGVLVPRGIVSRANNIARLISKTVSTKNSAQIALEGETIHQQILGGMAVAGSVSPAPAAIVSPGAPSAAPGQGVAVPAG
ncbi:MAG: hypothetical protein JRG91_03000 [Deltaproteobacteria bacterium]|nr:hypothetical protein [Deltaproteobacteria bacterium]